MCTVCTVCTCSPAACRPPVRAAGTSGHRTPSPSLRCGRPPPFPPRDCLRPPDAPPRLKDTGQRLTYDSKLGQCCQCPASCFCWTPTGSRTFSSYLYRGCRRPLRPPYGHSCAPPTGHEDTDQGTARFLSTSQHPAGSDQNPGQSGPRTRPWPRPCTHKHTHSSVSSSEQEFLQSAVISSCSPLQRSYSIWHLTYSNITF